MINYISTAMFVVSIIHTFLAGKFKALGNRYPEGSVRENLFHLLGETEVVFGFWSAILFGVMVAIHGLHKAVEYTETRQYTEPMFVFAIMTVAASKPVLVGAQKLIEFMARLLPMKLSVGFYLTALFIGPLLGSFVTEPGAMTIIASLLALRYYSCKPSRKFMYTTIAVLFVNVSIGGCLTHFAAPPVLMVAGKWSWSFLHMLSHFGWRAAIACGVNALIVTAINAKELATLNPIKKTGNDEKHLPTPIIIVVLHLMFMGAIVAAAHHPAVFMGVFLFFLGLVAVTKEYQEELKLKESMLVAFFLGGLVFLGGLQEWWLQPLISKLSSGALYYGATTLTAITDNAMLTYLASLVNGLSDESKYAVVAGALSGGGLTLIANAPNPAGFSILKDYFESPDGKKEFSSLGLFLSGILPTAVVIAVFWIFR